MTSIEIDAIKHIWKKIMENIDEISAKCLGKFLELNPHQTKRFPWGKSGKWDVIVKEGKMQEHAIKIFTTLNAGA